MTPLNSPMIIFLWNGAASAKAQAIINLKKIKCKDIIFISSGWQKLDTKPVLIDDLKAIGCRVGAHLAIDDTEPNPPKAISAAIEKAKAWGMYNSVYADSAECYFLPNVSESRVFHEQAYLDQINQSTDRPMVIATSTTNIKPGSVTHTGTLDWLETFADKNIYKMIESARKHYEFNIASAATQWRFSVLGWVTDLQQGLIDESLYRQIVTAAMLYRSCVFFQTSIDRLAQGGSFLELKRLYL